jgi:O-antigen biosynthesis protein WbqP
MFVFIKRIMDVILALIGMILLFPLLIFIYIIIKIDSKGSALFLQKRVGKGKRSFYILKFRTMRIDTPEEIPTHLLEDPEYYITRIGRILRRTSLDELPQLWNILLGHMSIVGPRPALWNQFDLIQERDKFGANDIRPGLTGLAQVSGRDELLIGEKARLDGEYVKRMSFLFDCRCIMWTFKIILNQEGFVEGKGRVNQVDSFEGNVNNKEAM